MKLFIFILLIFFCSCSAQRRFERLIKNHPELLTTDSVTVHDTIRVIVPEVKVDTVVDIQKLLDTVYLQQDQLKVKVWMDRYNKVYIQGQCDTVYIDKVITRKIPVKYYEKTPLWKKVLNYLILFLIIAVIIYTIYKLINKYLRK
jgi:hypothetical protein